MPAGLLIDPGDGHRLRLADRDRRHGGIHGDRGERGRQHHRNPLRHGERRPADLPHLRDEPGDLCPGDPGRAEPADPRGRVGDVLLGEPGAAGWSLPRSLDGNPLRHPVRGRRHGELHRDGDQLGGSTTAALAILVNDVPPSGLAYGTNPATYPRGAAIAPNLPSSTGGAVEGYAVTPALPAGITLHPTTGALSGTPTALAALAGYTVVATNGSGSTQASLVLAVVEPGVASLAVTPWAE